MASLNRDEIGAGREKSLYVVAFILMNTLQC